MPSPLPLMWLGLYFFLVALPSMCLRTWASWSSRLSFLERTLPVQHFVASPSSSEEERVGCFGGCLLPEIALMTAVISMSEVLELLDDSSLKSANSDSSFGSWVQTAPKYRKAPAQAAILILSVRKCPFHIPAPKSLMGLDLQSLTPNTLSRAPLSEDAREVFSS
jgi:hypothetical protein